MSFFLFQYLKSLGDNFGFIYSTSTPNISFAFYRSAQPTESDLDLNKKLYSINRVLSLRDDLPEEFVDACVKKGIDLHNIQMKDDAIPSKEEIEAGLEIIQHSIRTRIKLLVCCKGGRHRTGLLIACWRFRYDNWNKKEAWKEAEKYGWYDFNGHVPLRKWFEREFK